MKKHIAIYGVLILLFIAYNFFFKADDLRINTAINIIFASFIFGYIAYLAIVLLKKMGKKK